MLSHDERVVHSVAVLVWTDLAVATSLVFPVTKTTLVRKPSDNTLF